MSGFDRLPSVPDPVAEDALRTLVARIRDLGAVPLVHCCAADPPVALARLAGAAGVSVDAARLTDHDDEALGEAVEAGLGLFLGLVPALGPGAPPRIREVVDPARRLWARLGFPPERLPETVVVTPACGLAGASTGWARTATELTRRAARALAESPGEVRR